MCKKRSEKTVDWNVEYPLVRESMRAFTWETAAEVLKRLNVRWSIDDTDDICVSTLFDDVEQMIDGIVNVKYGAMTLDEVREKYRHYNFWVQNGRYGANTRYSQVECDSLVTADIHVVYEDSGTDDAYFSIKLVCSDQIF